jgi:hydrogenase nickel incorporation protein HypA/HybF
VDVNLFCLYLPMPLHSFIINIMHETSITQSILSLALDKAQEAGAKKITRVNLVVGDLSGVVGECVQMCFEVLGQKTIAEGAVLTFETKPTTLKCRKCNRVFLPADHNWACPDCRKADIEIISGRECYMESIEVD